MSCNFKRSHSVILVRYCYPKKNCAILIKLQKGEKVKRAEVG